MTHAIDRSSKRGTMLVVVLGLLVALFVIGTSFSFVTLSERKAAANYLDRQRALDLALDGVEYSIARLRAEATQKHYEPIGPGVPGLDESGKEYDPRRFTLSTLDSGDPAVSWSKAASRTSAASTGDGNWIDFNGDNNRGGDETSYGTDKNDPNFSRIITGFHADGINNSQVRNKYVARAGESNFGPSGTYEPLGDYFRVRTVDAASMLNLNNFREDRLKQLLLTLGEAIDAWLNRGKPTGKDNPFPKDVVDEFMIVAENANWIFESKDQLRNVWLKFEGGDRMYDMAMNFITVNSWQDYNYRDYVDNNNKVEEDPGINPLKLTDQHFYREGYSRPAAGDGRDGWPDWQPMPSGFNKAPVNINTATQPVLVCLFANMEARARLLFFQKHDQITELDKLIKDRFNQDVPAQVSGTTDPGRQNNKADVANTGIKDEANWSPGGENLAIFQLVPIGPISTPLTKSGNTSSGGGGGEDFATALAKEVMRLRSQSAFTSWQDFDTRFCRGTLLGLNDNDRSKVTIPDLVGAPRSSLQRNPQAVDGSYPKDLLPDAANCPHPANPIKNGDTAMTGSDFRAWYWKSCVDMIRASLCPSNLTARYNADYPMHMNVDRMDLVTTTAPICFSSMGIYEIVSQGEIMSSQGGNDRATSSVAADKRLPSARRQVRTVVQIYDVWRHSTQRDFASPLTAEILKQNATSATPTVPESLVQLSKPNTKTGPWSIDESTAGTWETNDANQSVYVQQLDDGKAIGYKKQVAGESSTAKDRIKGHNPYSAASNEYGWVTMNPRDEASWQQTREVNFPLQFHARFNESLRARTKSTQFPQVKVEGLNSDQIARDDQWGHLPLEEGAAFDDFISSASPRSIEKALAGTGGPAGANEFQSADTGEQATNHASLMPDGVFLRGGHIRPRSEKSLKGTWGVRGLNRYPRLKILRYPCGSGGDALTAKQNPFGPIRAWNAAGDPDLDDGVADQSQVGYLDPGTPASPGGQDDNLMRQRLIGTTAPFRGTDQHNEDAEFNRQHLSNMPYYQGTVDFWIKWDLPPQGANSAAADQVVALGEIDPASHNFSGLFGCTAYGRFKDSLILKDPAGTLRNSEADFEGMQFFVYKTPGGWFRFTRLYFTEAFGANVVTGPTGTQPQTVVQFGTAMRRIFDVANPLGGYTATNDVCNDRGFGNDNMGFLYARTDAWLNLSQATYVGGAGMGRITLRPHDWHRFSLSYNSNTEEPYYLWIDGQQIQGVAFFGDSDITAPLGFRNDGRHAPLTDAAIPPDDPNGAEFDVYRTTTKILEINPEDRLTVGCITRRQIDLTQSIWYQDYFNNDPDQGDTDKPPRPVFKFDANFVAVANATIDDFRVTDRVLDDGTDLQPSEFSPYSRYASQNAEAPYYENGFLPMRGTDGVSALPLKLGTISWIELRPDWDPYRRVGLTLKTSSSIEMEWAVVDDYQSIRTGGVKHDFGGTKYKGASGVREGGGPGDADYWANGGLTLNNAILPSGNSVGVLMYRAHFQVGKDITVNNVTPYLLDVTVTVLTPPRKLTFVIEY